MKKLFSYVSNSISGLGVADGRTFRGFLSTEADFPGDLLSLLRQGSSAVEKAAKILSHGDELAPGSFRFLPLIENPGKIVCVGLNYRDHSAESGFKQPDYPTLFGRFNSSLIGHGDPIERPRRSTQLDYEGELVAIVGKRAKEIPETEALDYIAGYSIFNDASVRDYQVKAPQWTAGKNFDATGAFGPFFVSADSLPRGCKGLRLRTRLNGQVVQDASIDDMVFSVSSLVAIISEFMTLEPGDLLVTGTPSGIGLARKPQLFMKDGDLCEVEIEKIGVLSNPVKDQISKNAA